MKFELEGSMDKGTAKSFYDNGNLKATAEIADGKLNGKYVEFYENNKIKKECIHKNGLIDGSCKTYYNTGKIFEQANYKMGYAIGTTTRYNIDGSKMAEMVYQDGEMTGLTEYNRGKTLKYQLIVVASNSFGVSGTTYHFSVSPEPKMAEYFIKKDGKTLFINGDKYTISKKSGIQYEFVAKGISQFGIPFMLTAKK
jgi:Uncharacterized protein conserved in bacteria